MLRPAQRTNYIVAIALILGSPSISFAESMPEPDANGDFLRRSSHTYWEVVDTDPFGLNCRMVLGYVYDANNRPNNIYSFPTISKLFRGERFEAFPSNNGVAFRDDRGLPWLFVGENSSPQGISNCFVRANRRYVKPVRNE